MIRKLTTTTLAALTLVTAAAAPVATAGNGNHNGFVADAIPLEFFYGFDGGFALFAGGTPTDACFGAPGPFAPMRVFARPDGTFDLKSFGNRDVELFLFETDGPAPDLIGQTCEALFDDDPTTNPPEPIATGTGTVKFAITGTEGPADVGGFNVVNSAVGTVTGEDGARWRVRGHAVLDVNEDGSIDGHPNDFQGLHVAALGGK